eukprot:203812-Chlamydomonas_euryale.AAC.2
MHTTPWYQWALVTCFLVGDSRRLWTSVYWPGRAMFSKATNAGRRPVRVRAVRGQAARAKARQGV